MSERAATEEPGAFDPAWLPLPVAPAARVIDLAALRDRLTGGAGLRGPPRGFTYLDCGAWMGDGRSQPAARHFGLVCGGTAALCELQGDRPFTPLEGGPAAETEPLNRLLQALAGPQRTEVTVHRVARAPGAGVASDERVFLLLPELHLPLVTRMPDLDPNLIPDPANARCPCHGPIVMRMLYGTPSAPSRYRAVGGLLSRNPNDWFYLAAESYRAAAADLDKLLDRLGRHGQAMPVHVVQLGGLCEVWTGFDCVFQGLGRVAFLRPTIVRATAAEALEQWGEETMDTRVRAVVGRMARLPAQRCTLLDAPPHHGRDGKEPAGPARRFEAPGVLLAENRPPAMELCRDAPPSVFVALREQKSQLRPWSREVGPGFRAEALASAVDRWRERPFATYAMAHSQRPCLVTVVAEGEPAAAW